MSDLLGLWFFSDFDRIEPTPTMVYSDGTRVDQSEAMLWQTTSYQTFRDDLATGCEVVKFYVQRLLSLRPSSKQDY